MPMHWTAPGPRVNAVPRQPFKGRLTWVGIVMVVLLGASGACGGLLPQRAPNGLWLGNLVWMDDGWVYAIDEPASAGHGTIWRFKSDTDPEPVGFAPPRGNLVGPATPPSPAEAWWPEGCDVRALARSSENVMTVAADCPYDLGTGLFAVDISTGLVRQFGDLGLERDIAEMAWAPNLYVGYTADARCSAVQKVQIGPAVIESHGLGSPPARSGRHGACALRDVQHPVLTRSFLYLDVRALLESAESSDSRPPHTEAWIERRAVPEGSPVTVVDGFTEVWDLAVSSDDSYLVVSGERNNDVWSCWVIDLDSGSITDLQVAKPGDVALSPWDDQVAISTGHRAVFRDL